MSETLQRPIVPLIVAVVYLRRVAAGLTSVSLGLHRCIPPSYIARHYLSVPVSTCRLYLWSVKSCCMLFSSVLFIFYCFCAAIWRTVIKNDFPHLCEYTPSTVFRFDSTVDRQLTINVHYLSASLSHDSVTLS